ncbi:formate/nitrite transporter family protein [Pleomorphomonas koreensis]|jgi:formate/nitrite transporter|uniref:formate/nitrite transporter family protein n=1 Tax=Pleomorphomonas koreensis TaxID=257440 RepID=UPI000418A186|nr:formate/nitrite transporter family protein [Pleomorphomonas koreensis]
MADNSPGQANSILGLDAYAPAEIQDKVEKLGVKKARMPALASAALAVIAGGSIGLGALFFGIVLADPTLGFAAQRLLGGLVFTLGLALVMIGGAELFTGNCLIVMAWANRQLSTGEVLRNWTIIWLGNLVGALGLVFLVVMAHTSGLNGDGFGTGMIKLAVGKVGPDAVTIFFKGVLCNILVCLAVWLSYAGRSVTDKLFGMVLPVTAFIAAGFEHCVANMFILPYAWVLIHTGHAPEGVDVSLLTFGAIVHNIIPATLGNIVGGAGFVGGIYWLVYRKALGGLTPLSAGEPRRTQGRPSRNG